MVFVDTGIWFAEFVPDDPDHTGVSAWFAANVEPVLTTDYCVDETLTLLVARKRWQRALEAGRVLFDSNLVQLHFVTADQADRAWILFQQRATAAWSFTDCTSKVVIDDLKIRTAAALDDHFRQFGNLEVRP